MATAHGRLLRPPLAPLRSRHRLAAPTRAHAHKLTSTAGALVHAPLYCSCTQYAGAPGGRWGRQQQSAQPSERCHCCRRRRRCSSPPRACCRALRPCSSLRGHVASRAGRRGLRAETFASTWPSTDADEPRQASHGILLGTDGAMARPEGGPTLFPATALLAAAAAAWSGGQHAGGSASPIPAYQIEASISGHCTCDPRGGPRPPHCAAPCRASTADVNVASVSLQASRAQSFIHSFSF